MVDTMELKELMQNRLEAILSELDRQKNSRERMVKTPIQKRIRRVKLREKA